MDAPSYRPRDLLAPLGLLALVGAFVGTVIASTPPSVAPAPTPAPSPTPAPPTPSPTPFFIVPTPSPSPTPIPTAPPTRITIPALRVDLPVIAPPDVEGHYPYCDVAEFIADFARPGAPGVTYIYAHARAGMFLPLLRTDDEKLLGLTVHVFTAGNLRHSYRIDRVLRHQTSFAAMAAETGEALFLQTSEGPKGTPGKTIVIAHPTAVKRSTSAIAQPTPSPRDCE